MVNKFLRFFSIILALSLFGCGLPSEDVKNAEAIEKSTKEVLLLIEKQKDTLESIKSSKDWLFLKSYYETEKWDNSFVLAEKNNSNALRIYNEDIIPILKADEPETVKQLRLKVQSAKQELKKARENANIPLKRKQFLLMARENAPKWMEKAKLDTKKAKKVMSNLRAIINRASSDYPEKKVNLKGLFAPVRLKEDKLNENYRILTQEYKKINSNEVDYAKLGDASVEVSLLTKEITSTEDSLGKKVKELYRSYSRTIVDMRVDYFVEIGRTSWDNYYDYPTEHELRYKVQVTEEIFNYFDSTTAEPIAIRSSSWGDWYLKTYIDQNMWNALNLNVAANWPSDDDEAEFWIANAEIKTYHKYLLVEDGKKKYTNWIPVSEDDFWNHEEHLGVTILSKPYGMFEDEVLTNAAPPGMEYIAKPSMVNGIATGSNQYGEWKQDASGHSFWHYYGQYSFIRDLIGPSRYSYDDWDYYNRRDRRNHYYGSNGGFGTYGHRTYDNSRYNNSDYARRNPNIIKDARLSRPKDMGANRRQDNSIKGAGTSNRGRGPAGGGK